MMGPDIILEEWRRAWPEALLTWSRFVRLREPIWCATSAQAAKEGLTGSFAMIRLTDHRIVIDIEGAMKSGVDSFSKEILAHEIGHHVYAPANLHDNARILAGIRAGLAGMESRAPFVANLYEDFLINDRLKRAKDLPMDAVFERLNKDMEFTEVWFLLMRTYEYLWNLKRGTLASSLSMHSAKIDADASLTASILRSYSKNWLDGGSRFAAMLYPYLMDDEQFDRTRKTMTLQLDAEQAGMGGEMSSGLTELEEVEVVDPRSGINAGGKNAESEKTGTLGTNMKGGTGPQQRYMGPGQYIDLGLQVNPSISEQELINKYYREIALPHLVSFPMERSRNVNLTIPEGTETWDISDPLDEVDWLESVIASPQLFSEYGMRKRVHGPDDDPLEVSKPLDVYVGIDCSGSMVNPRNGFSWPVLAATIIGLSALRAGAKVMGCLSGEPGRFLETNGFTSVEQEILTVITSYLGTGYSFGIPRLKRPFQEPRTDGAHIVLVTDDDIYHMLGAKDTKEDNWDTIQRALENAGGSGTLVLHAVRGQRKNEVKRLEDLGWKIHYVTNESEMLDFAATFSAKNYRTRK